MTDVLLPPWLRIARVGFRYRDAAGVSEPEFGGIIRTAERGGDRLMASLEMSPTGTSSADWWLEQRALKRFLLSLRGRVNRALLFDPSHRRAGSFPASELLTNNTFASGTSGWNWGGQMFVTVADRVARSTRTAVTVTQSLIEPAADVSVSTYTPYVWRVMTAGMRYPVALRLDVLDDALANQVAVGAVSVANAPSLHTLAFVPYETACRPRLIDNSFAGLMAGDHVEVTYTSLSRCALVDNGPNVLTQSRVLSHADWQGTTGTTVTNDYYTAPDGTVTGCRLIEDTSTGEHFRYQAKTRTQASEDWCFAVALRAGDVGGLRDRAWLRITDNGSTNTISAIFDLTNGVVSSAAATGGTATNARGFIRNLGNGWYYCCIIGRIPASDTSIRGIINLVENPSTVSYTGASSQNIGVWGTTLAQSSLPVKLTQTTTTAVPSGTAQTGSALYVKGLPASTSGLLLPGDAYAVMTSRGPDMNICMAPLNSDAAGLGYLQGAVPVRGTLSDNAAVIIHEPMGRFVHMGDMIGWDAEPGVIVRASADFLEA